MAQSCFKDYVHRHHSDLSVVMLKQISSIVSTMGAEYFILNNIRLRQKILLQE